MPTSMTLPRHGSACWLTFKYKPALLGRAFFVASGFSDGIHGAYLIFLFLMEADMRFKTFTGTGMVCIGGDYVRADYIHDLAGPDDIETNFDDLFDTHRNYPWDWEIDDRLEVSFSYYEWLPEKRKYQKVRYAKCLPMPEEVIQAFERLQQSKVSLWACTFRTKPVRDLREQVLALGEMEVLLIHEAVLMQEMVEDCLEANRLVDFWKKHKQTRASRPYARGAAFTPVPGC